MAGHSDAGEPSSVRGLGRKRRRRTAPRQSHPSHGNKQHVTGLLDSFSSEFREDVKKDGGRRRSQVSSAHVNASRLPQFGCSVGARQQVQQTRVVFLTKHDKTQPDSVI